METQRDDKHHPEPDHQEMTPTLDLVEGPRKPYSQEAIHGKPKENVGGQSLDEEKKRPAEMGVIETLRPGGVGAAVDSTKDRDVEHTSQKIGHSQGKEVPVGDRLALLLKFVMDTICTLYRMNTVFHYLFHRSYTVL